MATEEQKKENLVRMYKLVIAGLAKGLYDLFGESSFAVMHSVGDDLLEIMQQEMGLEVDGENVHDVVTEVARLFEDEFGFADKVVIDAEAEDHVQIHVEQCKGYNLSKKLQGIGIEHPFTCPVMTVMAAAIRKNFGKQPHEQVEARDDIRGSTITLRWEN
jgi:hypothetical protein